jgi:SpoVK/Ycf46/Vps4 family AAA+-type ATPase
MQKMAQTSFENGYGYRLITMIAGPSGTGKSQIAKQFATTINATISDDFNPTKAGENFTSLIKTVKPTKKKPLVVLLDEGDKMIERIHLGIKEHEFFVTTAIDKASFNKFMDQLSNYDNVFVIFTMNSTFNAIDTLDQSYTRCGRVDLKVNFGGDDSYNTDDVNFLQVKLINNIAKNINTIRFTPKSVEIQKDQSKKVI